MYIFLDGVHCNSFGWLAVCVDIEVYRLCSQANTFSGIQKIKWVDFCSQCFEFVMLVTRQRCITFCKYATSTKQLLLQKKAATLMSLFIFSSEARKCNKWLKGFWGGWILEFAKQNGCSAYECKKSAIDDNVRLSTTNDIYLFCTPFIKYNSSLLWAMLNCKTKWFMCLHKWNLK